MQERPTKISVKSKMKKALFFLSFTALTRSMSDIRVPMDATPVYMLANRITSLTFFSAYLCIQSITVTFVVFIASFSDKH